MARKSFAGMVAVALFLSSFFAIGHAIAQGGTAAISGAISPTARLKIRASSTTEKSDWMILVQQVKYENNRITPVALLAYFQFGKAGDPWVYPEMQTTIVPIVTEPNAQYKIAVYFFDKRTPGLQPHVAFNNAANSFVERHDSQNRTTYMRATFWDKQDRPTDQIHLIEIDFQN